MPGKIKQGQSIFIPFRNGMSIYDSQNKARMYMSKEKFKASFPTFRLGTENIELVEYAPVRKGRWIEDEIGETVCTECGIRIPEMYSNADTIAKWECKFCHNCGAKMEG